MFDLILELLSKMGLTNQKDLLAYLLSLLIILAAGFLLRFVLSFIFQRIARLVLRRAKNNWSEIITRRRVYRRLANLIIPILLTTFAEGLPVYQVLTDKIANIAGVIVMVLLIISLLDAFGDIYRRMDISRTRPIKGILQIVKVATMILGGVVAVAIIAGESPLVLLGGIGAMTAITSLIFKDAILGFVAGIQLTGNDMIRIGDWIEMPSLLANGTVVDLSLTTVQVKNFDSTITSLPAYSLISNAFINWRGMQQSGGRRIKRAIYIDSATVKMADEEMLERFRRIHLLDEYLDQKLAELREYNQQQGYQGFDAINGRRLTNVGTFRAYILAYLQQHPGIHQEKILMVRQLAPTEIGLPLEIYAFSNSIVWEQYETTQADIFDHIYAVIGEFGLSIYQQPSSSDIRQLGSDDSAAAIAAVSQPAEQISQD